MLEKVRAFVSKEAVLVVAVLAAAVSCALVPGLCLVLLLCAPWRSRWLR